MGYIRLLLAVSVFQGHVWAVFPPQAYEFAGGVTSVRLFYVISGFLMAMVLSIKYDRASKFYKSRMYRLLPVYLCVLGLTISISVISYFGTGDSFLLGYFVGYGENLGLIGFLALFVPQFCTIGLDLYGFAGINENGMYFIYETWKNVNGYQFLLVPQAWTLGIECWFYLLAPWFIKSIRFVYTLLALSILLQVLIDWNLPFAGDDPWSNRFFPSELQYFLFGVLGYKYKNLLQSKSTKIQGLTLLFTFCIIALSGIYPFSNINPKILCVILALTMPNIMCFSNRIPYDRTIGDLSYPFYLCHFLIIHMVSNSFLPAFNYPKSISFLYTLVVSLFFVLTVERRMNSIRSKFAN